MRKDSKDTQLYIDKLVSGMNDCKESNNGGGCEETTITTATTDSSEIDNETMKNDEVNTNGKNNNNNNGSDKNNPTITTNRGSTSPRGKSNKESSPNSDIEQQKTEAAAAVAPTSSPQPPTKTKKTKKSKMQEEDTSLEFVWICTECREAECATHPDSPLLVCEGPCQRPFHYPCAGLPSLPPPDEKWVCIDCKARKHKCFVCQEYGVDSEDIHKCDKGDCGLFYHLSCLSMYDVDIVEVAIANSNSMNQNGTKIDAIAKKRKIDAQSEGNDHDHKGDYGGISSTVNGEQIGSESIPNDNDEVFNKHPQTRPKFICPAHKCWTCSGGAPPENPTCISCPLPQCDENKHHDEEKTMKPKGKRKRGKAKKVDNIFGEKTDKRLFRCLDCPNAYHISCIPPSCKFHELALLCPEHAAISRLPYLDLQHSCQKDIEDRADQMVQAARRDEKRKKDDLSFSKKRMEFMKGHESNPFLPSKIFISGDVKNRRDKQINDLILSSEEFQSAPITKRSLTSFCLPCGIQEEVYSKPPVYNKISCNRHDQKHRPKRHPPTKERCQCVSVCDEHCLNRMMGVECVGDKKSPYWNCNCGVDCGNCLLSKKQLAKCRPKREQGKGWGLITINGVKKGELVEEYVGEIIDEKTKRERLDTWAKEHPNDPNFYIMALEPGWYIDAREKGGLSRFINHSCDPNCALVPVNVYGYTRIAIVAIMNIAPGEFLKYDYHFDTQDGDKFSCRCGAKNCRGTMKGGQMIEEDTEKKLTKSEIWSAAKAKLDRDKKFIEDVFAGETSRLQQTCATLPGEKVNSSSFVANGPDMANATKGQRYGVCLKRNVLKGSDFSSRYKRMKRKK